MRSRNLWSSLSIGLATVLLVLPAGGATYRVLHRFNGKPGEWPTSRVTPDAAGNLYGTTSGGGKAGCSAYATCGTVFELERTAEGYNYKTLHEFDGTDGGVPAAGVILDASGNLYGTTPAWGLYGYGTVFQVTPTSHGRWKEKVLHSFQGYEGANPDGDLIFDSQGNLYGTTYTGFIQNGGGVVFQLSPSSKGEWTETTLVGFQGGSGQGDIPSGALTFDTAGNLYGATRFGGTTGNGVVFELTPQSNGQWTETVVYSFAGGTDGGVPTGDLVFDTRGNLYGTTASGGDLHCKYNGCGVVFELSQTSGTWQDNTLYVFCSARRCKDGAWPAAGVTFDASGNLYGTTLAGGVAGCTFCGTVFKLTPETGGKWTYKAIHHFAQQSAGGTGPEAGVIFDSRGRLYGTTNGGGDLNCFSGGCGVVFEMAP
jgi:uncharacterized repeat protein (TIGR03803 family)